MKNKTVLMTLATLAVVVFVIGTHVEAKTYGLEQGSRYEGFLQDGSRYKGQMKDGEKDGVGTIFYPDGGRLDGTWYQDKIEGAVLFAYEDGSYFKGNYKNDEKNGLGVLLDEDGEVEAGLWRNGEEIDSLRKKETNGNVYYAEALEDFHGGKGIIIYANGNMYIGDLIGDMCGEGKGTMYYPNGPWYTGEWKNGKPDGKGISYGRIPDDNELSTPFLKCVWEEGIQTGIGVYCNEEGVRVVGDLTDGNGKYNGIGVEID